MLQPSEMFSKKRYQKPVPETLLESLQPETLIQMFYKKFGEIFKNTYFVEHLRKAASGSC